ncbi:MAG: hypothetical protein ACLFV7_05930 [Phycisphaerae bacterium]
MKKFSPALISVAVLCSVSALTAADGDFRRPLHRASKSPKAPTIDTRTLTSFAEDLDGLKAELSLSDEQVKKMQQIRDQRDKAIENWNAANEKKIEKIEDRAWSWWQGNSSPRRMTSR